MLNTQRLSHALIGVLCNDSTSLEEAELWKKVSNEAELLGSHAMYRDENLFLMAPFIRCHEGVVIAANPLGHRDSARLNTFIEQWVQGEAALFSLIEKVDLRCSLVIYAEHKLMLFRDRIGAESFYYSHSYPEAGNNQPIFFSSDLSLLLASGHVDAPKVNVNSALNHLLYGRPQAGKTLFDQVLSLESAHYATFTPHHPLTVQRYWSPRGNPLELNDRDARLMRLERALDEACLSGFGPTGNAIFLSGGLDSSYLAYIAAQHHRSQTGCYTITYADKRLEDESQYARIICDAFGLPLKEVELNADNVLFYLEKVLDDPYPVSAWASLCNHALADAAIADGNTNLLSGLGSDEVLANYDKALDYYFRVREFIQRAGSGKQDLLQQVKEVDAFLFPGVADFFSRQQLQSCLLSPLDTDFAVEDLRRFYGHCGEVNQETHLFSYMVSHECHHRIPDLLIRNFNHYPRERGGNIVYPFLETQFVEFACSLFPSERFRYENNTWSSKISLKQIVEDKFPPSILQRKRGTFDFPFKHWLKETRFYERVCEELAQSPIWKAGILRPQALSFYLDAMAQHRRGQSIAHSAWANELWVLFTLSAWYKRHIV